MGTKQTQPGVVPVRKLIRSHLLSGPATFAIVGLSWPGAISGGWSAGLIVICGISMFIEAYSINVSAIMLEQMLQRYLQIVGA